MGPGRGSRHFVGVVLGLVVAGCGVDSPLRRLDPRLTEEAPPPPVVVSAPVVTPPVASPSKAKPLRVLVGGDLIPHRPSLEDPSAVKNALAPLHPLFSEADAVLGNFEAATDDGSAPLERLVFAASPTWVGALAEGGLTGITVANNHACDLGVPGIDATLSAAAKAKLTALGADAKDPWMPRVVAERDGKKICAIAWTTLVNSESACRRSRRLAVALPNRAGKARIDLALARARAEHCDATVAILHGGQEYVPQVTRVLDQARHAAASGADAVVVHHPHIASPIEVFATDDGRHVPIFASVGNLVSNQGESWKSTMFPVLRTNRRLVCVNGWTRLGVIADLRFDFSHEGGPRLDWGMHLTWTENEHADDHAVQKPRIETRLLDPASDRAIVDRLGEDRRGPVALFDEPCWLEAHESASETERCSGSLVHGPRPAPPPSPRERPTSARKQP